MNKNKERYKKDVIDAIERADEKMARCIWIFAVTATTPNKEKKE